MRLRTPRKTLATLALGSVLAACGGSASETPEPARPDAWQLKLRHQAKLEAPTTEDAGTGEPSSWSEREAPAKSTWGSGAPPVAPRAEPSIAPSSPQTSPPAK